MYKYLILIVCMLIFYSCSEENNREPVTSDTTIPGQVSNVQVESLPGAVKLTYDMPPGQSLSYIKAECLINGVVRQVKASSYVNNLIIEGFSDESTYTVNIYSVNRSEKASEPVTVQVKPLAPPFQEVYKTLQLFDGFGGATVLFENPDEADLAISIIHIDSTGFWNQGETFYTKRVKGQLSVRGFPSEETIFGVFIRDRWNNTTDTLVKTLTPLFEKQLDRLKFKEVYMPGDAQFGGWGWVMTNLWNGDVVGDNGYVTLEDGNWPHWMTMDLGVEKGAKISRFKLYNRRNNPYLQQSIRKFEMWGSFNPNPDGSWDDWTLLLDEEIIKPSGSPYGVNTDEDLQALYGGFEFSSFPIDMPYVRYIRIKVTETWGGDRVFNFTQVMYWGSEPDDNPSDYE